MIKKGISHQRLRHCAFSHEEDANLRRLVAQYGTDAWLDVSQEMVRRSARQCRERWMVLTKRELSTRPWTEEEDRLLVQKCFELGPKWPLIEHFFVDRNASSLKNRWITLNRKAENEAVGDSVKPLVLPELKQPARQEAQKDPWDDWWKCDGEDADSPFALFGQNDPEIWDLISLPEAGFWE